MKKSTVRKTVEFTTLLYIILIAGIVFVVNACNKNTQQGAPVPDNTTAATKPNDAPAPVVQKDILSQVVTVAGIEQSADGTYYNVIFNENEEVFTVQDASLITKLQDAYNSRQVISISYNPWSATVLNVNAPTNRQVALMRSRPVSNAPGFAEKINAGEMNTGALDNTALSVINTTTPGLTNVIPDLATAQSMFDYIAHQCCAMSGPYAVDHCITFQYCQDGCYARAHKMCWIINNKYHYATHKIFSFAWGGGHRLSVKAEKWGSCCINWWFHVAPLVNIKTPAGVKAYVMDPAMFDQPVTLATWLHGQANPACYGTPGVTSINIQPTASYSPVYHGDTTTFVTDPTYSNTNSTLVSYSALHTCP